MSEIDAIPVELPLGEVIAIYRGSKHITQTQLAKAVGVSRNYISMIERGKNAERVSWGVMKRIIKELGFKVQIVADKNGQ